MKDADKALLKVRQERARLLAVALEQETGIPADCILGRGRDAQVVAVRHRLWRMLHESGLSFVAVGMVVGCDHTSVRHAVKKAAPERKVRVA